LPPPLLRARGIGQARRGIAGDLLDPARALIGTGLAQGEVIVTAGVQALRPGQQVKLLGAAP
jgi:hypothetical protein